MNAPPTFPADGQSHAIVVRDRRFGRGEPVARWWCNGDPIATAWLNSLSASFPRGEALFIESVKLFRDGAPPALEREIRAFIQQEVNHSREHLALNRAVSEAGYDTAAMDARIAENTDVARARPPIVQLAVTIALEHFTAMFAHVFLTDPEAFFDPRRPHAAIWRWHAVEEIEHKGVAYDTFIHATQDGITGWRARARLMWYVFGYPGVMRRIIPAWLAYFMPGFHPWNRDDRALIARYEGEFAEWRSSPGRGGGSPQG